MKDHADPLAVGPLPLAEDTRALIGQLWDGERPLTIAASVVEDAEKNLRCVIPPEVIAVVVAEGRTLHDLVRFTHDVKDWNAVLAADSEPSAAFEQIAFSLVEGDGTEPLYVCFKPSAADRANKLALVSWDLRSPTLPSGEPLTLAAYVEERVESKEHAARFTPELIADARPEAIRVRHPKFGEGTVVEDAGDDKWTIDFGAHGTKRLAKSFVTIVD